MLPGTYTVTPRVNGTTHTKTVQVRNDPRSEMTSAQLVAQAEAAQRMGAVSAEVNQTIEAIDNIARQLTNLQGQLRAAPALPGGEGAAAYAPVLTEITGTIGDLKHFRDSVMARPMAGLGYRQYPRLREEVQSVSRMITQPFGPPSEGELLRSTELRDESVVAQRRLENLVRTRVAKINQLLAGTPHVITLPPRAIVP